MLNLNALGLTGLIKHALSGCQDFRADAVAGQKRDAVCHLAHPIAAIDVVGLGDDIVRTLTG